jgi:hypothetical protein
VNVCGRKVPSLRRISATSFSWFTVCTVPSQDGMIAGQVRSRSAPSEADFRGPSFDASTDSRKEPIVKKTASSAARSPVSVSRIAMNAARSPSRNPVSHLRAVLSGASLILILRSDFARTSSRIPVLTQSTSGRRSRFTFVIQILLDPQYLSNSIGWKPAARSWAIVWRTPIAPMVRKRRKLVSVLKPIYLESGPKGFARRSAGDTASASAIA